MLGSERAYSIKEHEQCIRDSIAVAVALIYDKEWLLDKNSRIAYYCVLNRKMEPRFEFLCYRFLVIRDIMGGMHFIPKDYKDGVPL